MALLAIDTSERACSAALLHAGRATARSELIGRGHAERLMPLIDELLAEAGARFSDLTRLAVTTGPGTFTGLRIGLSVARGLALPAGLPCIGLSGLQVLAAQGQRKSGAPDARVHALMIGRGGQIYLQSFEGTDPTGLPVPVSPPSNLDLDQAMPQLAATAGAVIAGSGIELLSEGGHLAALQDAGVSIASDETVIDPVLLAALAMHADPALHVPDPLYLRAADAKKAVQQLPLAGSGQPGP